MAEAIHFGAMIPQGWRSDLPSDLPPNKQWDLIQETTRCIERVGFHSAWLYDHLIIWPTVSQDSCFECWTLLSSLASITKTLRLGEMVTCNSYRSPSVLAKMASTLDNISGGRLEFGLGAGWYEYEYKAYGYDFPKPVVRIRMLEEALQIIKKMWTEERATFLGKYYQVKEAVNNPKPLQKPHPPITVGGAGEQLTLRVMAKHADRVNIGGYRSYEEYERKFGILEGYCREVGRDSSTITRTLLRDVIIAETDAEAKKKAERVWPLEAAFQERRLNSIVGDPESCLQQLEKWKKLGITYFINYFPDAVDLEPMELFARRVMPELSQASVKPSGT